MLDNYDIENLNPRKNPYAKELKKQITINVHKFFDNIQFSTTNLNESATQIENVVLECLSRVLVQGATTA